MQYNNIVSLQSPVTPVINPELSGSLPEAADEVISITDQQSFDNLLDEFSEEELESLTGMLIW